MKKGIILILLLCSILIYDIKVKALALDGQISGQLQVNNSPYYHKFYKTSGYDTTTYQFQFNDYYEAPTSNYMVFTIQSLLYSLDTNHFSEHYGNGYTSAYTDTYSIYNIFVSQAQPRIQLVSTGPWPVCELQNNLIVCPIFPQYKYYGLKLELLMPESDSYNDINWEISVSNFVNLYRTDTSSIINNQNQNTQTIMDSNTTYNNDATQDYTNQTNEMDNITNAEDTLMNNLDFNTTDMNITINPNASTFIWNIVDALRLMSTKIVLLMTSILSIGVIKLVLNR